MSDLAEKFKERKPGHLRTRNDNLIEIIGNENGRLILQAVNELICHTGQLAIAMQQSGLPIDYDRAVPALTTLSTIARNDSTRKGLGPDKTINYITQKL
ncbi:MAG: hypothetical protein WCJ33_01775 [Pseudomonadota bacterium]